MEMTHEFWDFIEKYLPGYHEREDVLRQAQLQLYIDGHESPVTGEMSKDEARDELRHILYNLYHESIEACTQGQGAGCERCNEHHTKYCPACGKRTGNGKTDNPFRCVQCGSTDVQIRAWIHPNEDDRVSGFCSDGEDEDNWCNNCESHTELKTEDDLLDEIEEWWCNIDFKEMERITGYRRPDFSPMDGYREFVDTCNKYWEELPVEEKIEKWPAFNLFGLNSPKLCFEKKNDFQIIPRQLCCEVVY
jgi:hypothetical protein